MSKLKLQKWAEVHFEINTNIEGYDSGIYIYKYMLQYMKNGKVRQESFNAETFRKDVQLKIIKESNNLANACLKCGGFKIYKAHLGLSARLVKDGSTVK